MSVLSHMKSMQKEMSAAEKKSTASFVITVKKPPA